MPNSLILYVYLLVVLNRFRFLFYEKNPEVTADLGTYSLITLIIYFFLTITFVGLSDFIPELGLTPAFLESIQFLDGVQMSGLFVEKPHTGLSLGVFYFLVLAYIEYRMIRSKGIPRSRPQSGEPRAGRNRKEMIR